MTTNFCYTEYGVDIRIHDDICVCGLRSIPRRCKPNPSPSLPSQPVPPECTTPSPPSPSPKTQTFFRAHPRNTRIFMLRKKKQLDVAAAPRDRLSPYPHGFAHPQTAKGDWWRVVVRQVIDRPNEVFFSPLPSHRPAISPNSRYNRTGRGGQAHQNRCSAVSTQSTETSHANKRVARLEDTDLVS